MRPRVLLYCPTYKINDREQIKPETRKSIKAIEFDGFLDKEIDSTSKYPPPNYENVLDHYQTVRRRVLDDGYDALLTVEHDIIAPVDGLQKLWNLNVPVAYGIYLFRGSRNMVNAFRMVRAPAPDMSLSIFQNLLTDAIKRQVVEVSGCGNGFTLIRREVLEQIDFRRANGDNPVPDMPFATDCMNAGIQQWAHFGVQCGHVLDTGTIWLNLEGYGVTMTKVNILQNFVGKDGVKYITGEIVNMPDDLVNDYVRAGFIQVAHKPRNYVIKTKPERPVISVRHHQKKAMPLVKALKGGKFPVVDAKDKVGDALLIDHDIDEYGHGGFVRKFHKAGKPVFIYPHGAAPLLCWDGIHKPNTMVSMNFVTSKGHAEVLRRYEYPIPTHVIGWFLCDILPWKATEGKRILFAPIHPILGHLFMFDEDRATNTKTFERLLELDDVELTVRHIGTLEANGLWDVPGIEIHQGRTDNTYADIDNADLVISNGTMAYMAIARGKPTIMMNQMTPSREPDIKTYERRTSVSIEKYEKYMRFPFDVDNHDKLGRIIKDARSREPKQWRKRFIGEQFDPVEFCNLIGGLVEI